MRLQTIEALSKVEGVIVVEDRGMEMPTVPSGTTPHQVLKGCMKNTSTLTKLYTALDIHYSNMMELILRFIRQTAADDQRLRGDPAELRLLPVEGFVQVEIPVPNFQKTDMFQIHCVRCNGIKPFRNGGSRNDWVWVQTGGEANYGDLRGHLMPRLLALFKIRNILSEAAAVHRLALFSHTRSDQWSQISDSERTYSSRQPDQWSRHANSQYRGSDWTGAGNS